MKQIISNDFDRIDDFQGICKTKSVSSIPIADRVEQKTFQEEYLLLIELKALRLNIRQKRFKIFLV